MSSPRRKAARLGLLLLLPPAAALSSGAGTSGAAPEVYDLDRAVRCALEANRDLLVEREEKEKARYRVREAWAGALPQIGFEGRFNKNLQRPAFFFRADPAFGGGEEGGDSAAAGGSSSDVIKIEIGAAYDYTGTFSLTQPLWLAGKVGAALKAAKLYNKSIDRTVESRTQDVVLETRAAFYTALLAREEVAVYRQAFELAARSRETAELRRTRGLASEFEVLRAAVAESEAKPALIAAQNSARQALNDLKLVLGVDVADSIAVRGAFTYAPIPREKLEAYEERAVERSPDLGALALRADLLEQNLRVVRADRFPSFYLTGSYQLSGSSNDFDRFTDEERTVSSAAGVYVTFPFWTSGATTAKIRQARADLRIARIRLRQAEERVRKEVAAARLDLGAAEEQVEATGHTVAQAEKAYEIAETRYENGLLTQLELLDARLALTRTRAARLRALHDALLARAAWMRLVGIEWGEEW